MKSYNSALGKLNKNNLFIKNELISIKETLNRISASDVFSKNNYPSSDNTAFDGYAVNSKETITLNNKKYKKFKIIKTLAAGDNPKIKRIPKNSCIEVMTGAIIKKPFDTIIPIENVIYFPSKYNAKYIIINYKVKKNNHIRFKDSDYKKDQKVVVIEDLISTGKSSLDACDSLISENLKVKSLVSIFNYNFDISEENFKSKKIQYFSLCSYNYLIDYALENNFFRSSEIDELRKWRNDPINWNR